jgi:hypothetical protein
MAESGSGLPQSKDFVGDLVRLRVYFGRVPECVYHGAEFRLRVGNLNFAKGFLG